MAIESLDREYTRRLNHPGAYTVTTEFSMGEHYAVEHYLAVPRRFGHALLLFGNFEIADEISCQPWLTSPDAPGRDEPHMAMHSYALNEVRDGVDGFTVNDYEYRTPEGESKGVLDQSWTAYAWHGTETDENRFTIAVPDFYTSYDPHLLENKIDAIAAATEQGKILADHDIYISNMLVANGDVTLRSMY